MKSKKIGRSQRKLERFKRRQRNLDEFKKQNIDALCVYCAGCLATYMTSMNLYMKKRMKVYHIIELLQMAIGEKP